MKKILFPATNRVHLARQEILLDLLRKEYEVHICTYGEKEMSMTDVAEDITIKFRQALAIKPDLVLIRGDRFELLPIAMLCTYAGYKLAQIEAGDLSGVIDNKVRYAISHLADYHFTTNKEAQMRLQNMGFDKVYNVGSLDVEYALSISGPAPAIYLEPTKYILLLWHNVPGESEDVVHAATNAISGCRVIGVKGNSDYRQGKLTEQYTPQDFIRLMRGAACVVGNSSAGLKEASILGTPVVNIGSRQQNRLRTKNVLDVPCEKEAIMQAITAQIEHGKYPIDFTYYKDSPAKRIREVIRKIV